MKRVTLLFLAIIALSAATALGQYDVTLYVDGSSSSANDDNDGSSSSPLKTLAEATNRAIYTYKRNAQSTRIVVKAGTYRETLDFGTYTNQGSNQPGNKERILVEADPIGSVDVKGSDVWAAWDAVSGQSYFEHSWTENFGAYPDGPKWQGEIAPELVRRREMIFVNGDRMRQVLNVSELEPGTFQVDESADKIRLYPPSGITLSEALVEVALRERAMDIQYEHNITIRGINFSHAASIWKSAHAGVTIGHSDDLRLEAVNISDMNANGIYVGESYRPKLIDMEMNYNGASGWDLYRIYDFETNNTETNYNNQRGILEQWISGTVGNKMNETHRGTVTNHRSIGNLTRGFWIDYDNQDLLVEGLVVRDSIKDGLFIEANTGPIVVRKSDFSNNTGWGVITGNSEGVSFEDNVICDNTVGGVDFTGVSDAGRPVLNSEPGNGGYKEVYLEGWTFAGNTIRGTNGSADGGLLFKTTLSPASWQRFVQSLTINNNTYIHPSSAEPFRIDNGVKLTLPEWKDNSQQESGSTFATSGSCEFSAIGTPAEETIAVGTFSVGPAFPNPAVDNASFSLQMPDAQVVEVNLYDVQGRLVKNVFSGLVGGNAKQTLRIDSSDLPSGTYFFRVLGEDVSRTGKLTVAR